MSPRPYNLGRRQEAVDATYAVVIGAARQLLSAADETEAFTIESVARRADVARMTVYNRFKSRRGLLEAVFDDIAARGGMAQIPAIFSQPESLGSLDQLIAAFGAFWDSDRLALRRIRALGVLDADIGVALRARDENRRHLVRAVLKRVADEHGQPRTEDFEMAVNLLHAITGFEFFDSLAGFDGTPRSVVHQVQSLAKAAFNLG